MSSPQFQELYLALKSGPDRTKMSIEQLREAAETKARNNPVPADIACEAVDVGGAKAEWVSAPDAVTHKVLLYFHGGGYYRGSTNTVREMVSRMSRTSGLTVLNVGYRLAPEHPFPAAVDDALAAYGWLLESGVAPGSIAVGGDSAGGGLTIALMLAMRDSGKPLPGAGVCLSPWVDLTQSGESYVTQADQDPAITKPYLDHAAEVYLNGADARGPLASPLFSDLKGLPPLLIQVGTAEVLLDDARRLADAARAAGVQVELDVWEGMVHVWQNNGLGLPEGKQAVEKIGAWLRETIR